jgi:hypothetical protein
MLMPRFLFRSPERDRRSDEQRTASIRDAIDRAVLGAEQELAGLTKRLEDCRDQAASLLGTESEGFTRDRREEAGLKEAEARLLTAELRVKALKSHLATIRNIDGTVRQILSGATG